MARHLQFITVSNPTEASSPEARKLAYSHAFRQAHAQRRRRQMEQYRKELASVSVRRADKADKSDKIDKVDKVDKADEFVTASKGTVSSPLNQVYSNNRDVFSSLARPLSSIEYFLLNHYVHVIVPFTVGHCGLFDYPGDHKTQLLREWVGLAIADGALMVAAVLLSTCRYILQFQPDNPIFVRLALQYKQICLYTLRQEMSDASAPPSVMTVAKAIALAVDEVNVGEHTVARKHLRGVSAMVHSSGGAQMLRLTGLLERMYQTFMLALDLEDPEIDALCSKALTQG